MTSEGIRSSAGVHRGLRVVMFDPGYFLPDYIAPLCESLHALGLASEVVASPPLFEPVDAVEGYRVDRYFFPFLRGSVLGLVRHLRHVRQALKVLAYPLGLARTWWGLSRGRPGVFHLQWAPIPLLDRLLVAALRSRGWRVVYTVHDPLPEPTRPLARRQLGRLLTLSDALVVHTPQQAREIRDVFPEVGERVRVIPHGGSVFPLPSADEKASHRVSLGIPTDRPMLLFFGMIKPYKGLEYLVAAMPEVIARFPCAELVIAGEPVMSLRPLARQIDRLGLADHVVLRPAFVPRADVPRYMRAADMLVSSLRENRRKRRGGARPGSRGPGGRDPRRGAAGFRRTRRVRLCRSAAIGVRARGGHLSRSGRSRRAERGGAARARPPGPGEPLDRCGARDGCAVRLAASATGGGPGICSRRAGAAALTSHLKLGFAGCGEVAVEKHMPAVAEVGDIRVVAVADNDPVRLRRVADRFGVPHLYPDLAGLFAHEGLDAVAICLPPALQAAAAVSALDAGKHVWIDPPIGLSMADCDLVAERAGRSGRTVMAGFHMRWHRQVRQAREIVQSGRLGTIQTIRAVWNSPRTDATMHEWRRHRLQGGGALVEIAMDHFDLWRYLLDSEVEEIYARSVDGRWDDEASVIAGRMSNGVLVSAVLSERTNHDTELEIYGKSGRLHASLIRFEGLEFYPTDAMPSSISARLGRFAHFLAELPRAVPRMHRAGDYRLSYRDQWRHFLDCVQRGAVPASTIDDGRRALAVVLAAAKSDATNRPVVVLSAPSVMTPARR